MNRSTLATLVLLLVGTAVLIGFRIGGADAPGQRGNGADEARRAGGEARGAGSSRSGARSGTSSLPLLQRLRLLLEAGPESAPRFVAVERLVGGLADEELVALRDESAAARPDSVGGWVRCAVYAELARRDFEAAIDFLQREGDVTKLDFWGMRQAWFATYRGWAEVDAAAAAENLLKFLGPPDYTAHVTRPLTNLSFESYEMLIRQDDMWKRQAVEAVFAHFARVDPEAAWEALPASGPAGHRTRALAGFFRGMEGHPDLPRYLAQWKPAQHVPISGPLERAEANPDGPRYASAPGAEYALASEVTSSLVWTDEAGAREWFQGAAMGSLGGEKLEKAIAGFQAMELTRRDPGKAIAQAADGSPFGGNYVAIMVHHHPERVPELIRALEDHDPAQWWGEFAAAVSTQSRLEQADLFPAPGRMNRLPNFEQRYEWLLEAVSAGEIDETIKAELLERVHKTFSEAVPAAKDASSGSFQ